MAEKKTHTVKEVDELTLEAERNGFMVGLVEGHRLFYNALSDIKMSIENMQAIYYIGNVTGQRKQKIEELQLVWDTLTHLGDVFQGNYDTVIDNHKADRDFYDEIAADLDLDPTEWRESIASLKEEWPE